MDLQRFANCMAGEPFLNPLFARKHQLSDDRENVVVICDHTR